MKQTAVPSFTLEALYSFLGLCHAATSEGQVEADQKALTVDLFNEMVSGRGRDPPR